MQVIRVFAQHTCNVIEKDLEQTHIRLCSCNEIEEISHFALINLNYTETLDPKSIVSKQKDCIQSKCTDYIGK